jgi:hypothetical protein
LRLGCAAILLAAACARGDANPAGSLIDTANDDKTAVPIRLVVTAEPGRIECVGDGGYAGCGCGVTFDWQTDSTAQSDQTHSTAEIDLGALPAGTPVTVAGDVTCCSFPFPGAEHGGTVAILAGDDVVSADDCDTAQPPPRGCVGCKIEATYTVLD